MDISALLNNDSGNIYRKCFHARVSCSFGSNFFVFANIGQYRIAIASGTDVSIETDFSNEEAEIEENDTETAEEEEVEEEEEEEMLGILSGTTTDDLRMYINRKLETVQNGGHPFRTIKSLIEMMFPNVDIVIYRFGQKLPFSSFSNRIGNIAACFGVDVGLACEFEEPGVFLLPSATLSSNIASSKYSVYPFLKSNLVGNLVIASQHAPAIFPGAYKLIMYNTLHHVKVKIKHYAFKRNSNEDSSFEQGLFNSLEPILSDVTRHVLPAVETNKLRLEIYSNVSSALSIVSLKDRLAHWITGNVRVMGCQNALIKNRIIWLMKASRKLISFNLNSDDFSSCFTSLKIFSDFITAIFCDTKLIRNLDARFGFDSSVFIPQNGRIVLKNSYFTSKVIENNFTELKKKYSCQKNRIV